jgi:hypothetical protein
MQDKKLINVGGSTAKKSGTYSLEFHEEDHYAHIKRANNDGTATYFPFNAAGPTASNRFENYSDSGTTTYTAPINTDTTVILDGNGPFEDKRFSPEWLDHDLYNTTTGVIDLSGVPIGTLVHVTYDIELVPSSSNEDVHIFFRFTAFGGYDLYVADGTMRQQSTTHHYSGTKTFFVINEDVQNDGARLMINTGCDTQIVPNFMMIALL